jgi:glucuronoarabinoxylan endo-1,4-beta-xylanase
MHRRVAILVLFVCAVAGLQACRRPDALAGEIAGPAGARVAFALDRPAQTMEGFGGSDVWQSPLTDDEADVLFNTTGGIGLSLFRIGIKSEFDETYFLEKTDNSSIDDAKKALARNPAIKIIASPWSPKAALKSSGSASSGALLPGKYAEWANYLGEVADAAHSQGVDLYAISIQNEPDWDTHGVYEMSLYTPAEARDFIKVLGPVLAARAPAPKVLAPETGAWAALWNGGAGYADTIERDPMALSFVGIWGTHQYGTPFGSVSPPGDQRGRPIWVTEASENRAPDRSIDQGITIATWIHRAIVTGNASAWFHWWLVAEGNDTQALIGPHKVRNKRLWVVGNYSRFIRPGFVRYGSTGEPPADVLISFYRDPRAGTIVAVAVNTGGERRRLGVGLGKSGWNVSAWLTDASNDLASQQRFHSGGEFEALLPPRSVTTYVAAPAEKQGP